MVRQAVDRDGLVIGLIDGRPHLVHQSRVLIHKPVFQRMDRILCNIHDDAFDFNDGPALIDGVLQLGPLMALRNRFVGLHQQAFNHPDRPIAHLRFHNPKHDQTVEILPQLLRGLFRCQLKRCITAERTVFLVDRRAGQHVEEYGGTAPSVLGGHFVDQSGAV